MRTATCSTLLLGITLLVSGCGTLQAYPGPKRARADVALLEPARTRSVHVLIETVNGYALGRFRDRIEILPGQQHVTANLVFEHPERTVTARRSLSFEARAARAYTLHADWFLYGPRLRIEDDLGTVVAEQVTPAGEPPSVGSGP